ncbi:hypothetical protein PVK62_07735 [Aliivibrio sp. S3MY1]|uniref:Uncharacterized protein n=1 Tax=Aliivibrio wodanis TaxID=80852 RepID=A0A5Q4ZYE2_9GAMM|nr:MULTISPECIES: hypothetical protein [Aliivibrio]MDD9195729.1 hypothetical protein [Aliivibrio sp. S3MY1]VVV06884.1 hypothetical protein AW0309160_04378 [Aliivibrio wodanis]
MKPLFNQQGSEVPKRPKASDVEVKKAIIERGLSSFFSKKQPVFESNQKDALIKIFNEHWEYSCDEEELAEYVGELSVNVKQDALVSALITACEHLNDTYLVILTEWYQSNAITPPYPVGSKLDKGTITGISKKEAATYEVLIYGFPESSPNRRSVKFEDAILAEE